MASAWGASAANGRAQTYTGTDVYDAGASPITTGTQTFNNTSTLAASAAGAVSGGIQVFYNTSTLAASAANAVSGGNQSFLDSSTLTASAADAVSGGAQRFYDTSTLAASAANALSGGTQTFYDTSTLAAGAANAVSDGTQQFDDSSTLAASAAGAVSGGTQCFYDSSTLAASAAGAVSGGTQVLLGGLLSVQAGDALTSGAQVAFAASGGGTLRLNGHSTAVGGIATTTAYGTGDGSGAVIENASAAAGTLTVDTSASTAYAGLIRDGTGGGALSLAKAGTGTLALTGANTYTGGTTLGAGTIQLGNAAALGTGTLAFTGAGATLQFGGAYTVANAVTLTTGGIVDTNGQDGILSGLVSGGGGLTKQGGGTLTLTRAEGYTGGTTVGAGTLALGAGGSLAAGGAVSVASGAAFDIGASGADQTIGALSGAGGVTLGAHALTVGAADSSVFSGVVSGSGGLTKQGAGTLALTGANAYTGLTTVSAGTLEIDGTLASGQIDVQSGGTLRGSGTIGSGAGDVNIRGGATLAAGSAAAPGKLTLAADLSLFSGSTLSLRVESASSYDSLHVQGNVTIDRGATLALALGGGLLEGDKLTLIRADGIYSGAFDATNVVNSLHNALTFATSTVQGPSGEYDLQVVALQGSFAPFAAGGNQSSLARVLDQVAADSRGADLIRALNGLPGASLPAAFQQIVPVQQTTVMQAAVNTGQQTFSTLQNRMDNVRMGSTGLSLSQFNWLDQRIPGSALIAGTELPTGVKAFQPAPENRWGFFAAADGNFGNVDGQTVQSNYRGAGFTAGADYRLDQNFTVGLAAGYDYSKTDFDHSGSNIAANSVRLSPYALWKDRGGDWVEGTVGGAYHFYDSRRDTIGGMATSGSGAAEFDGSLKYGHDFKVNRWTLTPTFGLNYLHLEMGRYTETGSLAPLTIRDQASDSLRSNLGGTVGYAFHWKGVVWNPYVQAGWAHEFLDATQAVNARFASGAGDVFTTTGDNLGRESATFGTGLQAGLSETVTANLSYAGEANDRYLDNTLSAALRVKF